MGKRNLGRKARGGALLGLALALGLAACIPGRVNQPEPVGQAKVDLLHAQCIKAGGNFVRDKNTALFTCIGRPRDAGKICSKESDCQSACLARSRTCAPVLPLRGCNEILTESGLAVMQCIE